MSEEWGVFFRETDGNPASFFVDLGIRDTVPVAELPERVQLRLRMLDPDSNGFPTSQEFERLNAIDELLDVAVDRPDATFAGRVSSDGRREYFYYTSDGKQLTNAIQKALAKFPQYEWETDVNPDPEWSAYTEFLYPSPRELQTIQNNSVLMNLQEHGDDPSIPRDVDHWVYFATSAARDEFATRAGAEGFLVREQHDDGDADEPYCLHLCKRQSIEYPTINEATLTLFDLAEEFGGRYDGWETSVEKGESE
jgi:uncharacterized protein (TIGR01619 family)